MYQTIVRESENERDGDLYLVFIFVIINVCI